MLLNYFYDHALAQASYLIADEKAGEAVVIDPTRDVSGYVQTAEREGLRVVRVLETHIHADFVSGALELAAWTGARVCVSAMGAGNRDGQYVYTAQLLHDGESFNVGALRFDVVHMPGHTPEHLCFVVTDTALADQPMGIFTGDCLFVGDVGRPDLLDSINGGNSTREAGARQQFANVQRFRTMADYVQVWPGHGAGSACGKALGAVPMTTIGYERLFNPMFQHRDEDSFVRALLEGQPEAPRYFAQMKTVNREGTVLLETLVEPLSLDPTILNEVMNTGALIIDTRDEDSFARGHLPGTLNIPAHETRFSTWVGNYVDYNSPTFLIAEPDTLTDILHMLRAIGVDNIPGYFTTDVAESGGQQLKRVKVQEVAQRQRDGDKPYILDVRSESEYAAERIHGVHHIPMGSVPRRLPELPHDQEIIVQCGTGVRSGVVASLLQARGYDVANMIGGMDDWQRANLPIER